MSRRAAVRALLAAALVATLAASAPAAIQVATDALGDPLPAGATARLGTNRLRHPVEIAGVAFTPDGLTLLASGADGELRAWDASTGALRRTLDGDRRPGSRLACPADASFVALGCAEGDARVLDAATGRPRPLPPGLGGEIAVSPDGRWLAVWGPPFSKVSLLAAADGALVREWNERVDVFPDVAFSADSSRVALLGRRRGEGRSWQSSIAVHDVAGDVDGGAAADAAVVRVEPPGAPLTCIRFAPDGARLFAGDDAGGVRVLDATTGAAPAGLPGVLAGPVRCLAVSPDGRRLAASAGAAAVLLDAATLAVLRTLDGHASLVTALAFSPDGRIVATGCRDQVVRRFDAETGGLLARGPGHGAGIEVLAASPDGRHVFTSGWDGAGLLWTVGDGAPPQPLFTRADLLAGAGLPAGPEAGGMPATAWVARDAAFSPDGSQLAVVLPEGSVGFYGTDTATRLATWPASTGGPAAGGPARRLAYSPDGAILAVLQDDPVTREPVIRLRDAPGAGAGPPHERAAIPDGRPLVSALRFSPDGRLLASAASSVRLWDPATGDLVRELAGTSPIAELSFSPDGALLASAGADRTVRVHDVATGVLRAVAGPHAGRVNAVAWSPDGHWLASAAWNEALVRLWAAPAPGGSGVPGDAARGSAESLVAAGELPGHEAAVTRLAILPAPGTPSGARLVSSGLDAAALVWALPRAPR